MDGGKQRNPDKQGTRVTGGMCVGCCEGGGKGVLELEWILVKKGVGCAWICFCVCVCVCLMECVCFLGAGGEGGGSVLGND